MGRHVGRLDPSVVVVLQYEVPAVLRLAHVFLIYIWSRDLSHLSDLSDLISQESTSPITDIWVDRAINDGICSLMDSLLR